MRVTLLKILWLGSCALAFIALRLRTVLGMYISLLAFFTLCCIALGFGLSTWSATRKR